MSALYYIIVFSRLLLFIGAFKWWWLVKFSFYLECVCHVVEAMLPVDMEMNFDLLFVLIYHYMTFWLSYWHFWPNLLCLLLSLVPYYAMRVVFNGNSVGEALFFLCYIPWHLMNIVIIHWV